MPPVPDWRLCFECPGCFATTHNTSNHDSDLLAQKHMLAFGALDILLSRPDQRRSRVAARVGQTRRPIIPFPTSAVPTIANISLCCCKSQQVPISKIARLSQNLESIIYTDNLSRTCAPSRDQCVRAAGGRRSHFQSQLARWRAYRSNPNHHLVAQDRASGVPRVSDTQLE